MIRHFWGAEFLFAPTDLASNRSGISAAGDDIDAERALLKHSQLSSRENARPSAKCCPACGPRRQHFQGRGRRQLRASSMHGRTQRQAFIFVLAGALMVTESTGALATFAGESNDTEK
ncbi:hypothetical protein OKW41_002738 [Paraburkholderia sp. UCT70]